MTVQAASSSSPTDGDGTHRFAPDPSAAAQLDQIVRARLADSLATIFDSLDPPIAADAGAAGALLARIEAGPVPPRTFGAYTDLVVALFGDRTAEANALVDELLGLPDFVADPFRIVTLDDRELGPGQAERYRRFVSDDVAFVLEPVSAAARAAALERLDAAFGLLTRGAPEAFGEFRAIVRELVLVTGCDGSKGPTIGGASTFALWGALFLNVDTLHDRLTAAVALAHEAAHSHLLGVTLGAPLVEHDDGALYPSPLRRDPRPMEGVIHATYVLARMIYTLRALIESGALEAAEATQAQDQLVRSLDAYRQGAATVTGHARFTRAGAAAFEQMQLYMDPR